MPAECPQAVCVQLRSLGAFLRESALSACNDPLLISPVFSPAVVVSLVHTLPSDFSNLSGLRVLEGDVGMLVV